jgi:hypothetical protein
MRTLQALRRLRTVSALLIAVCTWLTVMMAGAWACAAPICLGAAATVIGSGGRDRLDGGNGSDECSKGESNFDCE